VTWGVTPSKVVNGGIECEGSFGVDDLYFGKAKPKRVSIPTRNFLIENQNSPKSFYLQTLLELNEIHQYDPHSPKVESMHVISMKIVLDRHVLILLIFYLENQHSMNVEEVHM
jgi:hypothetical protein